MNSSCEYQSTDNDSPLGSPMITIEDYLLIPDSPVYSPESPPFSPITPFKKKLVVYNECSC